jgi:transposase
VPPPFIVHGHVVGFERRSSLRQRRRLCDPFATDPVIVEAWKEALRAVYLASDRSEAELRLDRFFSAVGRFGCQPFEPYANGIRPWRGQILSYFGQPTSTGYAEPAIDKAKVIERRAYGLPIF